MLLSGILALQLLISIDDCKLLNSNYHQNIFTLHVHAQYVKQYAVIILYRIAGKFGGELNLTVWQSMLQPPNQNFLLAYIRMAILYRTAKI